MYNEILFEELFDIFRMGMVFGLTLGAVSFLFSWGFSKVAKLFIDIAK